MLEGTETLGPLPLRYAAWLGRGEELHLRLCLRLHGGGARRMELDDGVVVAYHSPSPSLPSRAWQIWPQPDFVGSICSLGEKERPSAAGDLRGTSLPAAAAADLGER